MARVVERTVLIAAATVLALGHNGGGPKQNGRSGSHALLRHAFAFSVRHMKSEPTTRLGLIGGSGLYDIEGLEDVRDERVSTPWGDPSEALRFGRIGDVEVVFIARHGRGHVLSPSDINYRANIDALKRVGVTDIISLSACGSLRADLAPGMFVLVDQFIDRTFAREKSFFGRGLVAHVSMAHPVCPKLVDALERAARDRAHPPSPRWDLSRHGGPAIFVASGI